MDDFSKKGAPLTVCKAIVRAISEDSRYNKNFTQDTQADFIEQFVKNGHLLPHALGISTLFREIVSCDIGLAYGDPPTNQQFAKCKSSQYPCVILTPVVYSGKTKELVKQHVHQLGPEYYSTFFEEYNINVEPVVPVKDFTCLIARMDPIRQSWLYMLVRRKIFNNGFVSFLMDTSRLNEFRELPPAQVFEEQYKKYLSIFATEHELVRDIVPYRNFPADQPLDLVIMQSRFNIVLETFFSNNEVMTFTEKIIRSLRLPRPWLLFSVKHAVKQLREWGFDTLDDLVDHSYDDIDHEILRQSAMLDTAQKMLEFDVVANQARLYQASEHNLALLKKWQENLDSSLLRDSKTLLDKIYNLNT